MVTSIYGISLLSIERTMMSTGTLSLQLLCEIALLEEGKASRLFVLDQTSKTSHLMGTKATRISRDSKSVSVKSSEDAK